MRGFEVSHLILSRALLAVIVSLAIAGLAQPASGETTVYRSPAARVAASQLSVISSGSPSASRTNATAVCKMLHKGHIRCTMTIKGGAGISGTVRMRITRGNLLVARGEGRVRHGRATLTMRVLRRMTPGRYTVAMVLTIKAKRVLHLR
jgi:hypothetical protein